MDEIAGFCGLSQTLSAGVNCRRSPTGVRGGVGVNIVRYRCPSFSPVPEHLHRSAALSPSSGPEVM
ncbi:hypothetical protein CW304_32870 [Bacillus sp. UFRGS-B20]|nr:hypothetical protein CW304_32870 [Bacillus sp. UFRGS-B20]